MATSKQFIFEGRQKAVLFGLMALGAVCMIITWFSDDALHTRFWTNYLHNAYMFGGVALMALFLYSAKAVAYSGWQVLFKRLWEAMALNLGVGIVLMLVVAGGVFFGYHHLYHWTDAAAVESDPILKGKASFLNKGWYALGVLGFMFVWYLFARKQRSMSLQQDQNPADTKYEFHVKKIMRWSAGFLPIAGFTSAAFVWLVMMSLDAHWFSTMFAWYNGASWMVTMIATTILFLIYLKSRGYYEEVTQEHFHDLGKYLFGFSIFWTYLWFSQYMLIWYANLGEETTYFYTRLYENPVPFWASLVINFVLPLLILIRNDTKRKMGTMAFMSIMLIFGHWLDFFQMVKYGPLHTAHEHLAHVGHGGAHGAADAAHGASSHAADATHGAAAHAAEHASTFTAGFSMPGLLEIGTFLGFAALFVYFVFHHLAQASMEPKHDPYLEESHHHHVI
jgi:hypothetical protein